MKRGQRASSSSESEEDQQPRSEESKHHSSSCGCSTDEESLSVSDMEAESAMKRSRFCSSFSFEDGQQLQAKNEAGEEELIPKNPNGVSLSEVVESELTAQCIQPEKKDTFCDTDPPRSSFFRPQGLWLAMTRCLTIRWPPCLSVNRESNRKLAYQVDIDQSEDTQSSVSSESTNESPSSTSTSDNKDVSLAKREEEQVRSGRVKSGPPPRLGVSRSSPRLPKTRQATDSVLASMILEKEMFLRIELVDSGEERDDLRYRAEWKLSERTEELAEGIWLSRSQKLMN